MLYIIIKAERKRFACFLKHMCIFNSATTMHPRPHVLGCRLVLFIDEYFKNKCVHVNKRMNRSSLVVNDNNIFNLNFWKYIKYISLLVNTSNSKYCTLQQCLIFILVFNRLNSCKLVLYVNIYFGVLSFNKLYKCYRYKFCLDKSD